ncbi:tight junction protein ZO-1-like isoform X1 [Liolophura sinensis]|uniref:tight junction protein ZO-1-like isoform X1 n=1 Tax=Liolophura sinensis TaxID=3198878 RepID=UPI0031580766
MDQASSGYSVQDSGYPNSMDPPRDMTQVNIAKEIKTLQNGAPPTETPPLQNGTHLQGPPREDGREPQEVLSKLTAEFQETFPLSGRKSPRPNHTKTDSHVTPSIIQSESFDLHSAVKTDSNCDRSGEQDTDGATSESVSTPETVVHVDGFDDSDVGENHTVVATARGVFDHTGGTLESRETGVSIVIPEGAIQKGVRQELYFKVCKDSSILPPLDKDKGETLLSPLVMCGPHGLKFAKPVELRLPHCASVNPDSWSFALKSSDSPTGHPTQWQNMALAGLDGAVAPGRVGKNSVSVLVDHF